jgi:hypothetical protein
MEPQDIIKLLAAGTASAIMAFGIRALFKGIKADGVVDINALAKGKIKTGSAGVLLLFFGTILFTALIFKGSHTTIERRLDTIDPLQVAEKAMALGLSKEEALELASFVSEQKKKQELNGNSNSWRIDWGSHFKF